jgi:hypothetical protein
VKPRYQIRPGELVPIGEPTIKERQWLEAGLKIGQNREYARIIKLLIKHQVLRDSILGDNWKVIYTETGALDIHLDRLEGIE